MKKASLSEDTLLRLLIVSIRETLVRLLSLIRSGQFQQARAEIDRQLEELLGLKADLARRLSDENILELLTLQEHLDTGSLYSLAELFYVDGQLLLAQGEEKQGTVRLTRALNLHLEVAFAAGEKFPESAERIEALDMLLETDLPEETLFSLTAYYEKALKFQDADQAFRRLLQITPYQSDIRAEQRAFYQRLLELPEQQLQAGGITLAELNRWLER